MVEAMASCGEDTEQLGDTRVPDDVDMERPGTAMSISSQAELGSESMMSFFRSYMTSILQPFSENLDELHKMVISISDGVRENRSRAEQMSASILEQGAVLASLRTDLDATAQRAKATEELLETTTVEQKVLEESVSQLKNQSKQMLDKIETSAGLLQRSIDKLNEGLEDTRKKVAKCQEEEKHHETHLDAHTADLGRLKTILTDLEKAQHATETDVISNQQAFSRHAREVEAFKKEQIEHRSKFDAFKDSAQKRAHQTEKSLSELEKRITQNRDDIQQMHDASAQHLTGRLDDHAKELANIAPRADQLDNRLAEQRSAMLAHNENVNKLMKHAEHRHYEDIKGYRGELDTLTADILANARKIDVVLDELGLDEDGKGKCIVEQLEDNQRFADLRTDRVEQLLGLEPMVRGGKNRQSIIGGVLLNDDQLALFQRTFSKFDADSSGSISASEVGEVMNSLGYDIAPDLLKEVVKQLDKDESGEVSFEEFCAVMSKIMKPDGTLDVEGYLRSLSHYEAEKKKQAAAADMVPMLAREIEAHKKVIDKEQERLDTTAQRVQKVEESLPELLNEMNKLRRGLDLNKEYWKGLSEGLRETKKVYQSGDGAMVANVARLRNLPPLDSRPSTHAGHPGSGNLTAR
eukprot:TRINITY_DN60077_c0_g1_i1.p1 TRINITY_DN60077_c0_g1~~TRINITY_DN60077_c0_g1_i1.p1  ORF type:complete len:650 (-),score=160.89 TRINITY_DN60077_c0_g1_i1:51-1961(-)